MSWFKYFDESFTMTQRGFKVKRCDQIIQRLKARVQRTGGRPWQSRHRVHRGHVGLAQQFGKLVQALLQGLGVDGTVDRVGAGTRFQILPERLQQRLQAGCTGPDGSAGAGDRLGGIRRRAGGDQLAFAARRFSGQG